MTRMWMVDPRQMCYRHLLGEHREIHSLVNSMLKSRWEQVIGHAKKGQVETRSIISRHQELVEEMLRRGYKHQSPLPEFDPIDMGEVDREKNLVELARRCEKCKTLMESSPEFPGERGD